MESSYPLPPHPITSSSFLHGPVTAHEKRSWHTDPSLSMTSILIRSRPCFSALPVLVVSASPTDGLKPKMTKVSPLLPLQGVFRPGEASQPLAASRFLRRCILEVAGGNFIVRCFAFGGRHGAGGDSASLGAVREPGQRTCRRHNRSSEPHNWGRRSSGRCRRTRSSRCRKLCCRSASRGPVSAAGCVRHIRRTKLCRSYHSHRNCGSHAFRTDAHVSDCSGAAAVRSHPTNDRRTAACSRRPRRIHVAGGGAAPNVPRRRPVNEPVRAE